MKQAVEEGEFYLAISCLTIFKKRKGKDEEECSGQLKKSFKPMQVGGGKKRERGARK